VHLEVAHALTVDSFLNAFRRFPSRRGKVHTLFSENGTNFVGAEKELRRTLCEWNANFSAAQLRHRGVRWQFNPPSASHMGGVWERLIRSAKKIFNALLLQQRVTDECLSTLMTDVEYILNSRPLIPVVLDPEAQEPLPLFTCCCAVTKGRHYLLDSSRNPTVIAASVGSRFNTSQNNFGGAGPWNSYRHFNLDRSGKARKGTSLWTISCCCTVVQGTGSS